MGNGFKRFPRITHSGPRNGLKRFRTKLGKFQERFETVLRLTSNEVGNGLKRFQDKYAVQLGTVPNGSPSASPRIWEQFRKVPTKITNDFKDDGRSLQHG
jgi:hypothetical protein